MILLMCWSCKKENPAQQPADIETGTLRLEFEHFADNTSLLYHTWYVNANNDSFTVSFLKYYISNISISNANAANWKEENSYHLVEHHNGSTSVITVNNVPVGSFTKLNCGLGVDSIRNVSGSQTGALDPSNNMFWSWNSGYIFFKMEGLAPKSPTTVYTFHVGGFNSPNSAYRDLEFSLTTNPLIISKGKTSTIKIKGDAMAFMNNPNPLNLAFNNNISTPGHATQLAADNYANMFSVLSVINN